MLCFMYTQYLGTQGLGFVVNVVGAAVLLDFSTVNSSIEWYLRRSLTNLIMRSRFETEGRALRLIQESVSIYIGVLKIFGEKFMLNKL